MLSVANPSLSQLNIVLIKKGQASLKVFFICVFLSVDLLGYLILLHI